MKTLMLPTNNNGQSKKHSIYEAILTTLIGTIIAFTGQLIFFPLFGVEANIEQNIGISLCFTGLSIVRNYFVRRVFNMIGNKNN